MNIIFMGTPDFAIPPLTMLLASDNTIAGIVTRPDRPRGRGKKMSPPPVKTLALQYGLPTVQPDTAREDHFLQWLKLQHPDLIVVVAFGQILPPRVLRTPVHGCINLHASLLPRYRGAAPINRTLINGDAVTGVTSMLMNEWMDTGDIILQRETRIDPEEDAPGLSHRLSILGAKLLLETINQLKRGTAAPRPQDHSQATYAPPLKRDDGHIDWSEKARNIHNRIRGTLPWPGAFTRLENKLLKIWKSAGGPDTTRDVPGTVVGTGPQGIRVATGEGELVLTEVQLQNRRRMTAIEFIKGNPVPPGTRLG